MIGGELSRCLRFGLACVAVGLGWAGPAAATWVRAVDLPGLLAASDLIVAGRAGTTVWADSTTTDVESFAITVDRVLKGSGDAKISVQLDVSDPGSAAVGEGRYGLFFLRLPAAGQPYVAADPAHPMLAASAGWAERPVAAVADPAGAVAEALVGALVDPALLPAGPAVAADAAGRDSYDRYAYEEIVEALRGLTAETIEAPLLNVLASGPTGARFWAANCLLSVSGEADVDDIQPHVLAALVPLLLDPDPRLAFTVSMLGHAMRVNLRSPRDVAALTTLLRSHDVVMRRTAASALSDIPTREAISALGHIALSDDDRDVRYFAVLGLAVGTGAGNAIAKRLYEQDEPAMTAFWRGWVAANLK